MLSAEQDRAEAAEGRATRRQRGGTCVRGIALARCGWLRMHEQIVRPSLVPSDEGGPG